MRIIAGIAGSASIGISIAVLAMAGASTAMAQTPLPQTQRALPSRLSGEQGALLKAVAQRTCPGMVVAPVAALPDGGSVDVGQGWLYRASLRGPDTGYNNVALVCDYGADRNNPSGRHKF